jgi:deoxyribodipyrimidine photo-lyase
MNIFIFTRDLRIPDNTGFIHCLQDKDTPLLAIFCFDPAQIGTSNSYRSDNAIDFMIESLEDLQTQFKKYTYGNLRFIKGSKSDSIHKIISFCKEHSISSGIIHMSAGFTPFEVKLESSIREVCDNHSSKTSSNSQETKTKNWTLQTHEDFLLWDGSRSVTPSSGEMFTRYTPFMRTAFDNKKQWRKPQNVPHSSQSIKFAFSNKKLPGETSINSIKESLKDSHRRISPKRIVKGGRQAALDRITYLKREHHLDRYHSTRNDLSGKTSQLSAYHKFGCISPRETHSFFSGSKYRSFTQEIIWRDYAYHRLANWPSSLPDITSIGNQVKWPNPVPGSGSALFKAWKEGTTGVPIVDAGMRQLLEEGYIHNRARMVVAQYLIKVLQIDWRLGEQHFAQWLTDYDWAVNFMNWLLISAIMSTEQVSRYMNPYIQMRKFDPDFIYIKKYIPELNPFSGTKQELHNLLLDDSRTSEIELSGKPPYPKPIVPYQSSIQKYRKWAGSYLKRTRKQHPSTKLKFKSSKKTRKQIHNSS